MAVIAIKAPVQRKPGPYAAKRRCESCSAYLSRNNPSNFCAPCSGGDWIPGEPTDRQVLELRRARLEEIGAAA
jgi:hypothetical protein